ncbi:MAG: hypothetical protein AAGI17_10785 [Planctomycetota bacterium]
MSLGTFGGGSLGGLGRAGAITTLTPGLAGGPTVDAQRDFADVLGISNRTPSKPDQTAEEQAHDTAERFIASTFIKPLLDSFSELSDPAPPFQRTEADKQFGSMLNGTVALEVVRSTKWSIVDDVASDLLRSSRSGPVVAGSTQEDAA